MRSFQLLFLTLLFLPHSLEAQSILKVGLLTKDNLLSRLRDFPLKNDARQDQARALFSELGCPKIVDVPLGKKPYPANVVCIVPGQSEKAILVGAHFDKRPLGEGKIDNGSGAVLLSALVKAMQSEKRRHTLIFAAFAEEEQGLLGSASLAKKGIEEKKGKEFLATISAMVNIDSVGSGKTAIALSQSDRRLSGITLSMAEHLKIDCHVVNVDQVGDSDGSTFRKKDIPVVQLHSLNNDTWKLLHTKNDTMEAIQGDYYFDSYRLTAYLLAQLDIELDQAQ